MTNNKTLMEFPCDFPIKIIGIHQDTFLKEVTAIVRKLFPELQDESILSQPSGQGKYLAVSILLHVQDQATLDALYQELGKHPDMKMVL